MSVSFSSPHLHIGSNNPEPRALFNPLTQDASGPNSSPMATERTVDLFDLASSKFASSSLVAALDPHFPRLDHLLRCPSNLMHLVFGHTELNDTKEFHHQLRHVSPLSTTSIHKTPLDCRDDGKFQ